MTAKSARDSRVGLVSSTSRIGVGALDHHRDLARARRQGPYHELGGTYFALRDRERATRRAISALNRLGYTVTVIPIDDAA
ncbi:hypothetical protein [Streptomyces torulosus]|uniref:hypothetical protein n=1 Tax=Streptomyces torulosus TaxID=68276 RepID=UPI0012FEC6A5|nr:hypothetical protein [Streptomyces torulosus]